MMTTLIGQDRKFINRGYAYQTPTHFECAEMGWTLIQAYRYCKNNEAYISDMKQWCKDHIWWQDYVWSYSDVSFKHERDATMFRLRWA